MTNPRIDLVCLDIVGTTVADGGIVERAFGEALATLGIVAGTAAYSRCMVAVHNARGMSDIDVFRGLFPDDEARARAGLLAFERSYAAAIDRHGLTPLPGAEAVIDKCAGAGVKVALMTGFSRSMLSRVVDTLGWWSRIDLTCCPEDVRGRGRPHPDMILKAVLELEIDDVRHVAVAGGTESDILAGRRAGAGVVAGVLTGVHSHERLGRAGATHVLGTIAELPSLVLSTELTTELTTA